MFLNEANIRDQNTEINTHPLKMQQVSDSYFLVISWAINVLQSVQELLL